ncbi:MAG TPA: hypothetical protein VK603_13895 [Candidatus Saccharimonadales bacterium]|nr:hypothetical protein [Candidatus Saccharimonadales bacterium]
MLDDHVDEFDLRRRRHTCRQESAEGFAEGFGVAGNANPERAVRFPLQPDLDPASNDNDCA